MPRLPFPPPPGLLQAPGRDTLTLRIRLVGGQLTGSQMAVVAAIADDFARGDAHITTRQGLEIPGFRAEHLDAALERLERVGLRNGSTGPTVRSVVACAGSDCPHALIDSLAIARVLDEALRAVEPFPHKFKLAVTGCPNACAKPAECDLGIMGLAAMAFEEELCMYCGICAKRCPEPEALVVRDQQLSWNQTACLACGYCVDACPKGAWQNRGARYAIYIGGRMGRHPRLAQRLEATCESVNELVERCREIALWYKANGNPKERFGDTLRRIGSDTLPALCPLPIS